MELIGFANYGLFQILWCIRFLSGQTGLSADFYRTDTNCLADEILQNNNWNSLLILALGLCSSHIAHENYHRQRLAVAVCDRILAHQQLHIRVLNAINYPEIWV